MNSKKIDLPPHPGDILEKRLEEMGVTAYRFAQCTASTPVSAYSLMRANAKFGGRTRRNLTAQMALRIARFFGEDPKYWMGLQADYDLALALADKTFAKAYSTMVPYTPDPAVDVLTSDKAEERVKKPAYRTTSKKSASVKPTPVKKAAVKKAATKKAAKKGG
ncbi:MAG: addiction module antidote protein, HigA family [Burkholderiaceae bacterium]|nr:MAG: addiction module antidote protein, HigA family [Burkholderiaceae bacterium]